MPTVTVKNVCVAVLDHAEKADEDNAAGAFVVGA
jgi:hypothetical protein